MDRFRALEYFIAAAEEGSLSGAARRLDVTIPAALKTVNSLERRLGVTLFDRGPHGMSLTSDGARYLDACRPLLQQLEEADQWMTGAASRPRGTVVLGSPPFTQEACFLPSLGPFHARYPDIDLDFRTIHRLSDADAAEVDVFVLFGWHEAPDMVQRRIAQTSYHVVASPSYWAAKGTPRRPRDLLHHECFAFRNPEGTLLDFWEFDRGNECEAVTVSGWLASTNPDLVLQAALAGEGITRVTYLRMAEHIARGALVPVLDDWTIRHPPPVSVFFRPAHRRTARIRLVVDFVTDLFARLQASREQQAMASKRPEWYFKKYGRSSRAARRTFK
jgi:LysR family transcriptional regulator, regulator for bpeEF and oprC